jgi:hypothetical protein
VILTSLYSVITHKTTTLKKLLFRWRKCEDKIVMHRKEIRYENWDRIYLAQDRVH